MTSAIFPTIVVRHRAGTLAARYGRRFEMAASSPSVELRRMHGTPDISAFQILSSKPGPQAE